MADNSEIPPIIIKKGKKHDSHHGGAWKVAYADFVTAMMALFIVLWVLGQDQAVKESVASYFKDPIAFSDKSKNLIVTSKIPSLEIRGQDDEAARQKEQEQLKQMGEKIVKELSMDPEFKNLLSQIKVEIVDEGLRIEIMDNVNNAFFEIGTAHLKSAARLLLQKLGELIAKMPNKIVVEGHTDSRPYPGDGTGYTNFELSADRANSARRALTEGGLPSDQIDEVRGYADRHLRDPKDPYSVVNRRISIIVKYTNKHEK